MILFKKAQNITEYLKSKRTASCSIGFVPTMGAIHEGHISLITKARKENDLVVASIFINPTQFNNPEDFNKYPVSLELDIDLFEKAGCDVLFLPGGNEIYPPDYKAPHYELGDLEEIFEGKFRPGHFQGVCQVVDRLLEIIIPQCLYLGQKDYQQCMVLKKLVDIRGYDTKVRIAPTLRETGGLAMSSRNRRLTEKEKEAALEIQEQLNFIKTNIQPGPIKDLAERSKQELENKGFIVDYFSIANADTLEELYSWDGKTLLVVLAAATINQVRLIDNLVLHG